MWFIGYCTETKWRFNAAGVTALAVCCNQPSFTSEIFSIISQCYRKQNPSCFSFLSFDPWMPIEETNYNRKITYSWICLSTKGRSWFFTDGSRKKFPMNKTPRTLNLILTLTLTLTLYEGFFGRFFLDTLLGSCKPLIPKYHAYGLEFSSVKLIYNFLFRRLEIKNSHQYLMKWIAQSSQKLSTLTHISSYYMNWGDVLWKPSLRSYSESNL